MADMYGTYHDIKGLWNLHGDFSSAKRYNIAPSQEVPVIVRNEERNEAKQITLSFISIRVIHNARNEVRNEEICGVNPCCSGTACCWSDRRGAAAEESPTHRIAKCCLLFLHCGPHGGVPAGATRAWVCGGEKHLH